MDGVETYRRIKKIRPGAVMMMMMMMMMMTAYAEVQDGLEFAALLHDVGKIAVPDAILRKPGPLTPEEWDVMHRHPYYSRQIVAPVEPLRRLTPWIYHHHERWDGTGYPDGLKGEAIPLAARIIAVADVWDALRSDRPYRKAWPEEKAWEHIREQAGKHFDPQVVEVFLRMQGNEGRVNEGIE